MKIKFNEIADFVAGQSPKSEYYSEYQGFPFLQGNKTFGILYPKIDTYTKKVTKIAHKGDILMSVRAPVGDLNFAPVDLCIGRGLASITAKDGDNAFLFYALKYNINNLIKQSNGTTYDAVTGDIVKDMYMIIPENKTLCKKISKLLYSLDLKIENNKKIILELEQMAKTIYNYYFLQFEFPNEKGKPYKSSGGKMIWNEELKKNIPEGWNVRKIGDILSKVPNTYKYTSSEYKKDGKFPIIDQSSNYICGYTDKEEDLLKLNDCVVFGDHTKFVKYVNFNFARGADGTQILNSSDDKLPNHLLYMQISNMQLVSQGYSRYFKFLKDKYVIIPVKEISDMYINKIKIALKKIRKCREENKELSNLRDYLLPLLINGQVSFKN